MDELEAEVARLRAALERCQDFLEADSPGKADEWMALRMVVCKALKQ